MKILPTRTRFGAVLTALLALAAVPAVAGASPGEVYTITNQPTGNAVAVFDRAADGSLAPAGQVSTGGTGTGGGLGNQGAVTLARHGRFVLAVNPGSDTLAVLRVTRSGLELVDVAPSGGVKPISITTHRRLVYVLNAGGAGAPGNISGFELGDHGSITPVPGSTRPLSAGAVGPAQVGFDPRGRTLVVTEKATNLVTTYIVARDGLPGGPLPQPSNGQTPFGFAFDPHGRLVVSEAFGGTASALSSYGVASSGTLGLISGSVPAGSEKAACWVVITRDGRFAYTTNTASGTVSGYAIAPDGSLTHLAGDGLPAPSAGGPIDAALSRGDRFLYVLNGTRIDAFGVGADGGLTPMPAAGTSGLPVGTNGLAAR